VQPRDYLMLRVLWRTGVRVNGLLTITARDTKPQNSVVNVTKATGGKQRRVHLDAETIEMLSEYVSAQQPPDDQPVFALKQRQVGNLVKRCGSVVGKAFTPVPSDTRTRSTACGTAGTSGGCRRCSGIRV